MDSNAYQMVEALHDKLMEHTNHVLTSNDVAWMIGVTQAMLTLYHEDHPKSPEMSGEARRPPQRTKKKGFWGDFFS